MSELEFGVGLFSWIWGRFKVKKKVQSRGWAMFKRTTASLEVESEEGGSKTAYSKPSHNQKRIKSPTLVKRNPTLMWVESMRGAEQKFC